jgi:hypothetical protein
MPFPHGPQSMLPPQLSPTTPQYSTAAGGLQLKRFVQSGLAHTPAIPPPPQVCGALQFWQSSVPPQPSPISPQYLPPPAMLQVSAVQLGGTQTPPRQIWPSAHAAQSSARPQPSPIAPQYLTVPPEPQVSGVQLGPPTQMLLLQIWSPGQTPQSSFPPAQPLPIWPQYRPSGGVQVTLGVHWKVPPPPLIPPCPGSTAAAAPACSTTVGSCGASADPRGASAGRPATAANTTPPARPAHRAAARASGSVPAGARRAGSAGAHRARAGRAAGPARGSRPGAAAARAGGTAATPAGADRSPVPTAAVAAGGAGIRRRSPAAADQPGYQQRKSRDGQPPHSSHRRPSWDSSLPGH